MTEDERYMRRCLQLASNGLQNAIPNPMVGAVIVCDGRIIGEGYHVRCGEGHAEVNAVKSLRLSAINALRRTTDNRQFWPESRAKSSWLEFCRGDGQNGCEASTDHDQMPSEIEIQEWIFEHCKRSTIYVSLEPCSHFGKTPPCADLLVALQFKRCVMGCVDPFAKVQGRGIQKLKEAGIEVTVGVLEEECKQLNKRFFTFHGKKRPYILLKWAQTPDGYMDALRENDRIPPLAISNSLTGMKIHKLRSEYQAILVGKNTDRLDHPSLTVRHWVGKNPKRLVIDRPIPELLNNLHEEGIQSLMVEGGAKLLNSFLEAGLWDEIQIEIGDTPLGEEGVKAPVLPEGIALKEEYGMGHVFLRAHGSQLTAHLA